MNQELYNLTSMQSAVAAYMDKNKTIWSGTKATVDTVAELNANNEIIKKKANDQETATEGAEAAKLKLKHDFEAKILEIADQLSALAHKTNNVTLGAQVELTPSALDKLEDDQLEAKGKNVSALATANLVALGDYNVTAADVTALDTLTTNWGKVKTAPRTAIAARSSQTKTLPQAVRDNTSLLRNQLDKQMTKRKATDPEFYAGYLTVRVVINRRSHHAGKPASPTVTPSPAPPQ